MWKGRGLGFQSVVGIGWADLSRVQVCGQVDGQVCDMHEEQWLKMYLTELFPCVTGLTGRKDALEDQKASGSALCSDISFQVAMGKSLSYLFVCWR